MPGERVAEYVAEMFRLPTHCKFDGYMEDELCDQRRVKIREGVLRETSNLQSRSK